MGSRPDEFVLLLRYAHTRDEALLDELVELYASRFTEGSKLALLYGIICGCFGTLFLVPALVKLGWTGCGIGLVLVALTPLLYLVDRWRWRRFARRSLRNGKPIIYRKLRIGTIAPDAGMFQSYWKRSPDDRGELELDHPLWLLETVQQADEWWQWLMDVPHWNSNRGRPDWLTSHFELGLVRRRDDGTPELVAGGQIYYSYDPWSGRVEKWD